MLLSLTERQARGLRDLLRKVASLSAARYDQWLRDSIGDDDTNAVLVFLRAHALDPYDPACARGMARGPDGKINNCALACEGPVKDCQMCEGDCPDKKRTR